MSQVLSFDDAEENSHHNTDPKVIKEKIGSFLTKHGYVLTIGDHGDHLYHRPNAEKYMVKCDLMTLAEKFELQGHFNFQRHSYRHAHTSNRVVVKFERNHHLIIHSFKS